MTDFLYVTGSSELWDGTIDLLTATIKAMLITSSYTASNADDVVDAAGANDPVDHELTGTGYVAGWGNSGRKALASKQITVNKGSNRSEFDAADVLWSGINAGTASQLCAIEEGGADDTTSRLISHHDFAVVTNGGDVTAQIADLIRLGV